MNLFGRRCLKQTWMWFVAAFALVFTVGLVVSNQQATPAAASPDEGVIYYLLTEDNEITIRYPKVMGGVTTLGPRAFEVLMIEKVDRLNQIAENYGAKWTHFTAVGTWMAAEQAEERSAAWKGVYSSLLEQVRRGNAAGHEYAPHPHGYWDPRVELNTLVWDPAKGGYTDNSADYQSWTTGFRRLGSLNELNSAAGYLYDYKRRLMEITHKETVVERTGSWQFGNNTQLMEISLAALRMNGILANSDAHANLATSGNAGAAYGSALYFTAENSINKSSGSTANYGTLEFTPTPSPTILYDSNSLQQLNSKVDEGVKAFLAADGRVKPGVHFIVGFTHAKNMIGSDGWQSTDGGAFSTLDKHLAYIVSRYVKTTHPVIRFARASDAVKDYYDYYSERAVAVREDAETRVSDAVYEYPVRILGKTASTNQVVNVKPPIWWDAQRSIAHIQVLADDKVLGDYTQFTSPYPDLSFQTQGVRRAVMRITLKRESL